MTKPQTHELKIYPEPFNALVDGRKTFEFRRDDRDFRVGDILRLLEWEPVNQRPTGRTALREITYILRDDFNVPQGFAVLAVRRRGFHIRKDSP